MLTTDALHRFAKSARISRSAVRQSLLRNCARLVFCSYTLLVLSPVMPIVMDNLAHTFWAQAHYRLVHMHNGKAHVHTELRKMAKDAEKDRIGGRQKFQKETPPHIAGVIQSHSPVKPYPAKQRIYAAYACTYPSAYPALDYPPPKA